MPWKPQYNEKFVVKLTKESPLVLVLCQLDDRYFKGLRGQYSFRLQFRLHERSRPGAEDYIVRSHGNYLMDRSVSVELPSMPPGEYSVFLSVAAERDVNLPSVEEVVRRECRRRSENEKLAQVGMAYDLAHAKAAHHLEQVARARRKAEAKKASESRKKERRRAWEKRHLQKDILRRQEKKNEEKREKRKAEEEAKRPKDKSVQTGEPDDDSETKKDKATQTEDIVAKTKEKQDKNDDNDKDENVKDENHKNDNDTKDKDKKDGKDKDAEGKDAEAQDKKESDAKEEHADSKGKESADADAASDSSASAQSTPKSTASKPATPTLTPSPSSLSKGSSASRSSFPSLPPAPSGHRASYGPVGNSDPTSRSRGGGHHGPPPPAPGQYPGGQQFDSSDSESSASPISDWEECYSSDDMAMKPRLAPAVGGGMPMTTGSSSKRSPIVGPPIAGGGSPGGAGGSSRGDADSDEDDLPEPWNAVCVVGFRVYCKDPDLEVRVVMEGGELEEGGMGERGAADLDNAQANAAGGATGDAENGEGSEKKGDGKVNYDTIVNKGEEEDKKGGEGGKTVEMKEGGTQTDAGTAAATVSELDKKPETVLTAEPTPDGKGAEAIVPGVTPGLQTRPPAASCTCGKAQGSAESAAPAAADDDDYVKNSTAPSASPLSTPGNVTPSSSSHPTPDTTPVAGSGRSDGADPELYGS